MSLIGKPFEVIDKEVTNDGFFPNINLTDLKSDARIPAQLKEDLVTHQLVVSMIEINKRLSKARLAWISQGENKFEDIDLNPDDESDDVNGRSMLKTLYFDAVYSWAKALLIPDKVTLSRRDEAENSTDTAPELESHYYAKSHRAVISIVNLSPLCDQEKPKTDDWSVALI